jgi:hypothetical protein
MMIVNNHWWGDKKDDGVGEDDGLQQVEGSDESDPLRKFFYFWLFCFVFLMCIPSYKICF